MTPNKTITKISNHLQDVSLLQEQGSDVHAPRQGRDRDGHRGYKGHDPHAAEPARLHRPQVPEAAFLRGH